MNERPDIRASYMPIEHLHAEIVAAPMVSKIAFKASLTSLDPNLRHEGTRSLWRETESLLLSRFPGLSTDELISRRDRIWFPANDGNNSSLTNVLQNATALIVDSLGRVGRPNPVHASDTSQVSLLPDRQRRLLRWLSFALPPDLFLSVSGVNSNLVETLSPNVAQGLAERGY